jgi:5-methylcytosine-specific restriction endonuclease McrA
MVARKLILASQPLFRDIFGISQLGTAGQVHDGSWRYGCMNRLENERYKQLRRNILKRDGWLCQFYGAMTNLEVHHQQFRSHSGEDTEENLFTLCHNCHRILHGRA